MRKMTTLTMVSLAILSLVLLIAGCDDDGGGGGDDCSTGDCNTSCRIDGFASGYCSNGDCRCETGGGDGDGDSDADPGCRGHNDCSGSQICIAGDCVAAYGRDYRITIASASGIPDTNLAGDAWDWPGGLPDPYAALFEGSDALCATGFVDNTLSPLWYHDCGSIRVNESSRYAVGILDADDLTDDEVIGMSSDFQIRVGWIKDGAFTVRASGIPVEIGIEPR